MAATRQFENLRSSLSEQFFEDLFKGGVGEKSAEKRKVLDEMKHTTPLNPGRSPPFTWNNPDLSDNLKSILVIGAVLDEKHSSSYTTAEKTLSQAIANLHNKKYNIVTLETNLADQLLTEHVKRETPEVNYHRDPHPNESAGLAKTITLTTQNGEKSSPEEKARSASAFAIHDAEYGEPADGINEISSAVLLYQAKMEAYNKLQVEITNDNTLDPHQREQATDAIEHYKQLLAYEAWKSIVSGTTMLKKIDGQPTVFTAQKLAIEPMLGMETKPGNALDRQTMIMSMVDSNFAAFIKQLQTHPEMSGHLPSQLLENISPHTQAVLFNAAGEPLTHVTADQTSVDVTGLLYGQNERMFPEIHAAYKAALFKSNFHINGKDINGVVLWNQAMEAARTNDTDTLKKLLTAGTTAQIDIPAFPPGATPPPPILAGSTLQDIFIHRIGSEMNFAKGQGPELYQALANALGFERPDIQYDVWREHVKTLENLRDRYQASDPNQRFEIAQTLFHIASHQPGVYLDRDKRIENIETALNGLDNLEGEKEELESKSDDLVIEIYMLEEKIKLLEKEKNNTPENKTNSEENIQNSTNNISQRLIVAKNGKANNKITTENPELQKKLSEQARVKTNLNKVSKAMKAKPRAEHNLNRTRNELRSTMLESRPQEKQAASYRT